MTRYVALLRGIGPGNPQMRNENLRAVCAELGFTNVATVISSGNIVFDADTADAADVEAQLESAWPDRLGFESTTILRSRAEVASLVERRPFGDLEHGKGTYLLTTFAKRPGVIGFDASKQPSDLGFRVVGATDGELFTSADTSAGTTPDVMSWLEKLYGKELTSRTWLTVQRISKKMG